MNDGEYLRRKREIEVEKQEALEELQAAYALSNNMIKEGDIIRDHHLGKIRVEGPLGWKIPFGGKFPMCVYSGPMLRLSDNMKFKNGERRDVYAGHITEVNGKKANWEAMRMNLKTNELYHFKGQPERLIYLGNNWSGNGYWHQFALVERPDTVWAEMLTSDMKNIVETNEKKEN